MNKEDRQVNVILLAAGRSTRMGRPKALLPWGGSILLEQACRPFSFLKGQKIAVLSAPLVGHKEAVESHGFEVHINEHPERGQSESLHIGLKALSKDSNRPLFCAVVDQPLLSEVVVKELCNAFDHLVQGGADRERLILCPRYGKQKERGNPVLFGDYWLPYLQAIEGDQGGRAILRGAGATYVKYIDFEIPAGVDVDTPDDYTLLYEKWGSK